MVEIHRFDRTDLLIGLNIYRVDESQLLIVQDELYMSKKSFESAHVNRACMINVVHVFDSNLIVAPEGEGVAEAGVAASNEDAPPRKI